MKPRDSARAISASCGPSPPGYVHGRSHRSFVLLIVIAVIMWIVLHRSVYGRYLFAVGRNEEAAKFSGINTDLVIGSAYAVSMLAGRHFRNHFRVLHQFRLAQRARNFYELYGIAAAVLGGCSLRGGEGSILGILLGTALLQVLQNLVNLLGIPSSLNFAVMGTVILIGVLADEVLGRRMAKSRSQPRRPQSPPSDIRRMPPMKIFVLFDGGLGNQLFEYAFGPPFPSARAAN